MIRLGICACGICGISVMILGSLANVTKHLKQHLTV